MGTRVYGDALFELLAEGLKLDDTVGPGRDHFPSVSIEQAKRTHELAYRLVELNTPVEDGDEEMKKRLSGGRRTDGGASPRG